MNSKCLTVSNHRLVRHLTIPESPTMFAENWGKLQSKVGSQGTAKQNVVGTKSTCEPGTSNSQATTSDPGTSNLQASPQAVARDMCPYCHEHPSSGVSWENPARQNRDPLFRRWCERHFGREAMKTGVPLACCCQCLVDHLWPERLTRNAGVRRHGPFCSCRQLTQADENDLARNLQALVM